MNLFSKISTVALSLFALPLCAQAQNASGGCKNVIVKPITIAAVNDAAGATINFGVVVPGIHSGTVYVSHDVYPSGAYGPTGGSPGLGGGGPVQLLTHSPAPHAADFVITGQPNFVYVVTTSNPTSMTLSDGTATMTMTWAPAFVMVGGAGSGSIFGQDQDPGAYNNWLSVLNATGNGRFSQSGVLTVSSNQKPGLYSGTWTETVSYQ